MSLTIAWLTTAGLQFPIWNLEIVSRPNTILIKNLLELMIKSTSGLPDSRIDEDRVASTAEVKKSGWETIAHT